MNYQGRFPPQVLRDLQYDPPGMWMPPLPKGCIRLSAGYPFPESIPIADLLRAGTELAKAEAELPFLYLGSPSMARLPDQLRQRCAQRQMTLAPNEILVTAGACQAMDLAARALLAEDSLVAVEAPTYMEALEVLRNYTTRIVAYSVDADGLDTEALGVDLAERRRNGLALPTLLYTIASYQNPTGACLSPARRRHLLQLAQEYDFLILEDDAYGELGFAPPVPTLKALDTTGRVIYLGSLSKVIAPGLRIGWAAAPAPIIRAMSMYKKDLDHSFAWSLVARYLAATDLPDRIDFLRSQYRDRRDRLLAMLREFMPAGVVWTVPAGGYFLWVRVPGVNTTQLLDRALAAGVAFVPGRHFFFTPGSGDDCLRLSYSHVSVGEMKEGVRILGGLLR